MVYENGTVGPYLWSDSKLYIYLYDRYLEYPPEGVRALLIE